MNNSVFSYLHYFSQQLSSVYESQEEQQQIAFLLLQKVTNKSFVMLMKEHDFILTHEQKNQLQEYLTEHIVYHKPLQYILGSVPFLDLEIRVEPPTLIPRPETEEWVFNVIEALQKLTRKNLVILDMCTGSGAIALSLAKALPQATIYAVDSEEHALVLAKKNADFNGITRVIFLQSNLFDQIPQDLKFDLIVTNPPYISELEYNFLDPMVKKWEDYKALVAHDDGLDLIKRIIEQSCSYFRFNDEIFQKGLGNLYCEIGYGQGNAVKDLLYRSKYQNVKILKDLTAHDRVVVGFYRP